MLERSKTPAGRCCARLSPPYSPAARPVPPCVRPAGRRPHKVHDLVDGSPCCPTATLPIISGRKSAHLPESPAMSCWPLRIGATACMIWTKPASLGSPYSGCPARGPFSTKAQDHLCGVRWTSAASRKPGPVRFPITWVGPKDPALVEV